MEVYNTSGTCSRQIIFKVDEDERITNVRFIGGCSGNLQGIAKLVEGQRIDDIIDKLQGIVCRSGTSCPDQLAKALVNYKTKKEENNQNKKA